MIGITKSEFENSLFRQDVVEYYLNMPREKLYETQIDNLKSAARLYVVDPLENDKKNIKKLENGEIESFDISLDNLKKQGKIDKNFENPKTGEPFKGCIYVKVTTNENGIFEYTVVDNCN